MQDIETVRRAYKRRALVQDIAFGVIVLCGAVVLTWGATTL